MALNERAALREVHPLKMDDESYSYGAFALQKDSEFLEIFNHYITKQYEHGILHRLFQAYHTELLTKEQFSISEPQPLRYENVVFPFTCLVLGVTASLWIAIVEMITRRLGWSWGNKNSFVTYENKRSGQASNALESNDKSCSEKTAHFDIDNDRLNVIEVITATIEDLEVKGGEEGVKQAILRLTRLSSHFELQ